MSIKEFKNLTDTKKAPLLEMKHPICVVGIDPGEQTGVARYDKFNCKIGAVHTFDFWDAYSWILTHPIESTIVVVENGSLNKTSYHRADLRVREDLIARTGQSNLDIERKAQDRASRNVGSNNRESVLLMRGIARAGFAVLQVRPQKTKWDKNECAAITGYLHTTNSHTRDAIRLAWDHKHLVALRQLEYRLGQVI